MLEKAVRICDATFGNIYRWDGEALHLVATHDTPPAFAEARRRSPRRRNDRNQIVTSILTTKAPVHVVDAAAQPGYIDRSDLGAVQSVELGGVRTFLAVPMLKDGELIGGFTAVRGHSSNTRMRWRIVSRMRGRCLVVRSKMRRALSRLLPV